MMKFRGGYRYQLAETLSHQTDIVTGSEHKTQFVTLGATGLLTVASGYAWNGASGPAIQSLDTMRASLLHDACYQLIRLGYISANWKDVVDCLYRAVCLQAGMPHARAEMHYLALQQFGHAATLISAEPKILLAP